MKIYVIIPTHNSERTIQSTLESYLNVKNSTMIQFEAIIVDDHSIDSTISIIQNISSEFRIILNTGNGVSEARNSALSYLYNEKKDGWVIFLDSDDYLYKDFFVSISNLNIDTYNYIAFEYRSCEVKKTEEIVEASSIKKVTLKKIDADVAIQQAVSGFGNKRYNFNSPWGRMIRIDFLKQHKLYFKKELGYKEDFLFNLELLSKKPDISICTQVGYIHILNQNSVVNNFIKNAYLNEKIIQKYLKELNLTEKQKNIAIYNGWLGLQYVYVFPKHYVKDNLNERQKRYLEIHGFVKPFRIRDFYGKFYSKEFIFYILYKFKMFTLLDWIFSIRR